MMCRGCVEDRKVDRSAVPERRHRVPRFSSALPPLRAHRFSVRFFFLLAFVSSAQASQQVDVVVVGDESGDRARRQLVAQIRVDAQVEHHHRHASRDETDVCRCVRSLRCWHDVFCRLRSVLLIALRIATNRQRRRRPRKVPRLRSRCARLFCRCSTDDDGFSHAAHARTRAQRIRKKR